MFNGAVADQLGLCVFTTTTIFDLEGFFISQESTSGCTDFAASQFTIDRKNLSGADLAPTAVTLFDGTTERTVTVQAHYVGTGPLSTVKGGTKSTFGSCAQISKDSSTNRAATGTLTIDGETVTVDFGSMFVSGSKVITHCNASTP